MENTKGITLISLTIYIIGITIVIGIITSITNFFYQDIIKMDNISGNAVEFSKFEAAFIKDIKAYGAEVTQADTSNGTYVVFNDDVKYLWQDGKIYRNKVAIADNVTSCTFTLGVYETKQIVTVNMTIGNPGGTTYSQNTEYVVSYE